MLYFVLHTQRNAVKIGYSANPAKRLNGLQNACPDRLRLLGVCPGDKSDELELHIRLDGIRLRGEWFRDCEELRRVMEEVCAGHKLYGRCPRCGVPAQALHDAPLGEGLVCEKCDPPGGLPATLRRGHDPSDGQRRPAGGGYRVVRKKL